VDAFARVTAAKSPLKSSTRDFPDMEVLPVEALARRRFVA
jgi:hypothetical protein